MGKDRTKNAKIASQSYCIVLAFLAVGADLTGKSVRIHGAALSPKLEDTCIMWHLSIFIETRKPSETGVSVAVQEICRRSVLFEPGAAVGPV